MKPRVRPQSCLFRREGEGGGGGGGVVVMHNAQQRVSLLEPGSHASLRAQASQASSGHLKFIEGRHVAQFCVRSPFAVQDGGQPLRPSEWFQLGVSAGGG